MATVTLIFFYILPWILFLLAIGTLFIDLSKPKRIFFAIPILLLGLIFVIIINVKTAQIQSDQDTLYSELHERALIEQNRNHKEAMLTAQVLAFQTQNDDLFYPYSQMGATFEGQFFKRLLQVDELLYQLLGDDPRSRINDNIQIYRLPNDINQVLVAEFLHGLGYQVYLPKVPEPAGANMIDLEMTEAEKLAAAEEMDNKDQAMADDELEKAPAKDTPPTNPDLLQHKLPGVTVGLRFARKSVVQPPLERPPLPTANHLLVGKKVSGHNIKVITLALLRAGVEVRAIKRISKLEDNPRDLHVELDWTGFYAKKPIINPEKLIKKRSFK